MVILLVWVVCVVAPPASGATVTGNTQDQGLGNLATNITFKPLNLQASRPTIFTLAPIVVHSDTNGNFSRVLLEGDYQITIGSNARDSGLIHVQPGTNTFNWVDLLTSEIVTPAGTIGFVPPSGVKGDIFAYDGTNWNRFPAGVQGQNLQVDTNSPFGLVYTNGAGSGTVTSVGVIGFAGISASGSPVTGSGNITLSTTLNGVLKGTGSGFTTATGGTDYEFPLTFNGPLSRSANAISLTLAGAGTNGYLSGTDWNTFNGKVSTSRAINTTAPLSGGGTLAGDLTLSMAQATGSVDGWLGHVDWTTFNNKVGTARAINTTAPITGGGDLTADRTLAMAKATGAVDGYLAAADFTALSNRVASTRTINTTSPITGGGDLSADRTLAMAAAGAGTNGYLSGTDWSTFNGKQATLTGTANQIIITGTVLSTPQNIDTGAAVQHARIGLGAAADSVHLLKLSGGTVTADTHLIDGSVTWNSGGITFTAQKVAVTDTASASGSLLQDWTVGGVSKWKIDKTGAVLAGIWNGTAINLSSYASGTLQAAQFPALTGDITTAGGALATTLKNTGTAGTYYKTTFDGQGRETSGQTSLSETDLTFSDITTLNASTSQHGLIKKLDNNAAHYMDGTGAWSTPAGGGGGGATPVFVSTTYTNMWTNSTTTMADATGFAVTITPQSTNSTIMVTVSISAGGASGTYWQWRVNRGGSEVAPKAATLSSQRSGFEVVVNAADTMVQPSVTFMDSPATTSAVTYQVQFCAAFAGPAYVNKTSLDSTAVYSPRATSYITALSPQ